jgi:hypothetical protein
MESLRTIFFSFLALLSACAGNVIQAPDLIAPSEGNAVVYIYRVDLSINLDRNVPNVRINNKSIGPLTRRGYFRVEVNPGSAQVALYKIDRGYDTFWPAAQDTIVPLMLAPNSTHFVELSLNMMNYSFKEVSRDTALRALAGTHLLN